ncbi:tetratricopeptide repeat protein [Nitrospira sp. Kam-Ns4a]
MPYKIKIESKRAPVDEADLLSGAERFLFWVEQNRKAVLVGLAVFLLVVAGIAGVIWYDLRNAERAAELSAQATRLYLDRPLDQPAKASDNLKQAIALYRQIVEQFPRSPSAPIALFELGNALMQANDVTGALEAYRKFIAAYGANKTLLGLVYQRMGYAHLVNGDREQALKAFTAVLEVPGAVNKDQALFELGKLEEAMDRPEGALARYQDLMKSYPNSPFAGEASVRLKALEAKKGPAPAAPASAAGQAAPTNPPPTP